MSSPNTSNPSQGQATATPPKGPAFIEFKDFQFGFENQSPLFRGLTGTIPRGARVLLVGANGVGKSTLLRILAGLHLIPKDQVLVQGHSPFEELSLSQEMCWVGSEFPLNLDLKVRELYTPAADPVIAAREQETLELLGIQLSWSMARVSDGQRRRVQLFLALKRRHQLLLLDEVTAHLDVVMRADLLGWLKARSQAEGTTTLYATHIFDGLVRGSLSALDAWPTHVLWLGTEGRYEFLDFSRVEPSIRSGLSLSELCENWIRKDSIVLPSHP